MAGRTQYPRQVSTQYGDNLSPKLCRTELPNELVEEIRPRMQVSMPVYRPQQSARFVEEASDTGLSIGQMVRHGKFGVGVVLDQEGRGKQARVQVNFEEAGSKWLVLAYAKLEPA